MMAQHKANVIYCKADPSEFRRFFSKMVLNECEIIKKNLDKMS